MHRKSAIINKETASRALKQTLTRRLEEVVGLDLVELIALLAPAVKLDELVEGIPD